jgi:phosphoglycolate phosphatase-like HAD superfamily hydrolase
MLTKNYCVFNVNGQKAYIKKDRLTQLKQIDGIIFDCDGVLVDIRNSYNKAISVTVVYILEALTDIKVPEKLVSDEVIFLFRKTGGFNNDWDTVYGILMYVLSSFPDNYKIILKEQMTKIGTQQNPFNRLSLIKDTIKKESKSDILNNAFFEKTILRLKEFTKLLDASGTASVDRNLTEKAGSNKDFNAFYNVLKSFLHSPPKVGKSVIGTVFEETFLGAELFFQTFGVKPAFNNSSGMIENEKVIVQPEVLERLTLLLGGKKLGVASGSRVNPAKYVLRDLIEWFNSKAITFLETTEEAERKLSKQKGTPINLKKPNPYSLLKAAEGFGKFSSVLYVGDSVEDFLMAKEASKTGKSFVFAGVYRYSGLADLVRDGFLESDCDMVIPSVNDLPSVLETVRRGKNCV